MLFYSSVFLMLQSLLPGGQKTNPSEVWSKKTISVFDICFTGSTSASHSFNNGLFSVLVQTLLLKHTIGQQDQIFKSHYALIKNFSTSEVRRILLTAVRGHQLLREYFWEACPLTPLVSCKPLLMQPVLCDKTASAISE